jgi:hypothetical protein
MSLLFNIIVMLLNFRIIIDTLFAPSRSVTVRLFAHTMAFQLHTHTHTD